MVARLRKLHKKILEGHTAKKEAKKIRSDRELIEEILLLLRASEKEKVPTGPTPIPYERTLTALFMKTLNEIVEQDRGGIVTQDFLHSKLREIEAAVYKLGESKNRSILLDDLSGLIERTKPAPQRKPKPNPPPASLKKPFDEDDDIPF